MFSIVASVQMERKSKPLCPWIVVISQSSLAGSSFGLTVYVSRFGVLGDDLPQFLVLACIPLHLDRYQPLSNPSLQHVTHQRWIFEVAARKR